MKANIQSRGFTLTKALYNYVQLRLHFSVDFASNYIQRARIILSDINGPRGGEYKRCHLVLTLAGMPTVVINDIDTNLYVAIDRAVECASHAVARQLERKHSYRNGNSNHKSSSAIWQMNSTL